MDMSQIIATGIQSYETLINNDYMYVDKTDFIQEWWENGDAVTLITRPRRFGKTLMMDMCNCFFSNEYKGRKDLFKGKKIFQDEKYRKLQGTYPVLYLSFADIKKNNYSDTRNDIIMIISDLYEKYKFIPEVSAECDIFHTNISDSKLTRAIQKLCLFLEKYYQKKVIILLDEYDTPMQEAYVYGYWDEITCLMRSLFNSTFKTNLSMERAIMTGITRISKESIFSDLNNLTVVTTTSQNYASSFGFTENEVFQLLDVYGLDNAKSQVKQWYDGFVFGNIRDIYNPWSIINFLKEHRLSTYWANTSGNALISNLCRTSDIHYKKDLEILMSGQSIEVQFDEQIIFDQLDKIDGALWSLMVASGYLKIEKVNTKIMFNDKNEQEDVKTTYVISLTNFEVKQMMSTMILQWFNKNEDYKDFLYYLINDDVNGMNDMMNELTNHMMSSFDSGKTISRRTPERFYHGFVLGLLVDLRNDYIVTSNRESGLGRYDVMIEPKDKKDSGYIFEFKVFDRHREKSLFDTASNAINQINEKKYETYLKNRGVRDIHKYGFAFQRKEVLILKG